MRPWDIRASVYKVPRWRSGNKSACQCGRCKRHRLGRSPGGGNGNPLQGSCLENRMDRGAWWATVQGVAKRWTWLSVHTHTYHKHCCHLASCLKTAAQGRAHLSRGPDQTSWSPLSFRMCSFVRVFSVICSWKNHLCLAVHLACTLTLLSILFHLI